MATAIGDLVVRLAADTSRFNRGMRGARGPIADLRSAVAGIPRQFAVMAASAVAGAVSISAAFMGVKKSLMLSAEFEQTEVALTTMLGSAGVAKRVMADLQDFAARTPFEIPGITEAAKLLTAFGIPVNELMQTLENIGNVSAGISLPINEIAMIYGKARVQHRVYTRDLNELTGRGIPVIKSLAEQFGIAESEVRHLAESGKLNFGHIKKAFEDMSSSGGQFAGLMEKQSQTLAGLWSTLRDNVTITMKQIGDALVNEFDIKGMVRSSIAFTQSIRDWVPTAVRAAKTFASVTNTHIVEPTRRMLEYISEGWQLVFENIMAWLEPVQSTFRSTFSNIVGYIDVLLGSWEGFRDGVIYATAQASIGILGIWEQIKNSVMINTLEMKGGFIDLWHNLGEMGIKQAMPAMATYFIWVRKQLTELRGEKWLLSPEEEQKIIKSEQQRALDELAALRKQNEVATNKAIEDARKQHEERLTMLGKKSLDLKDEWVKRMGELPTLSGIFRDAWESFGLTPLELPGLGGGAGGPVDAAAADKSAGFVGALERGSKDAWSAILKAMGTEDTGKRQEKLLEAAVDELTGIRDELRTDTPIMIALSP